MVEGHFCFAPRDVDASDVAFRKNGQRNEFLGGLFVDLDFRACIFVRGHDAIFAVMREVGVGNIPRCLLNHLALALLQVVARDVHELITFVREEVEVIRFRVESFRRVGYVSLMRGDVLHHSRCHVVEIDI